MDVKPVKTGSCDDQFTYGNSVTKEKYTIVEVTI